MRHFDATHKPADVSGNVNPIDLQKALDLKGTLFFPLIRLASSNNFHWPNCFVVEELVKLTAQLEQKGMN